MSEHIFPGHSWSFSMWCEIRGHSRTTGYRLLKDGEIRTYKARGRRYVTEAADREFIARKEAEAQVCTS